MKKIIASLFMLSVLFVGCEKDITTEDISKTTYYVTFSFDDTKGVDQLGNQMLIIEKGTSYSVNENFTAMEGEEDVSGEAQIDGTVDGNTPGYYQVVYSAVNADGYSAGASKGVFVSDPDIATDLEGSYSADIVRSPSGGPYFGSPASIVKITDGLFFMDRMLGSYYYDGVGYSAFGSYFVHGFIRLHADNTISHQASLSPAWQDTLEGEGMINGKYDPATGVITFSSLYAGGRQFHVTYTPN